MLNAKKYFGTLIGLAVAVATVLPACTPADRHIPDPNDRIELTPFCSILDDETSVNNYYPFGIFAPTDWTQKGYDLSFTDGTNIYDYFRNEGYGEFYYLSFELYTPFLSLKGTDGEYAYGYVDFGSSTVTSDLSLNEYLNLFLKANDYERPQTVNEITMTAWTPRDEKTKGLSFDMEISSATTERIVVFKMSNSYMGEADYVFGVFHIGCKTEAFDSKKTLFDRMETQIFGFEVRRAERFKDSYFKNVQTVNRSALGLTMKLPQDYSPFTVGTFPAYANSYGTAYLVWGNDEGYSLEDAGTVKVEIYRDPVKFSDVFAPIKNLYTLHEEDTYELGVAPPMLTTLSDGTVAVYSAHNSFKDFERVPHTQQPEPADYYMHVGEATRKIVYTFIHGEFIYKVAFTLTFSPVFDYADIGKCGPTVTMAMTALNNIEEYLVFSAMDSLTFK